MNCKQNHKMTMLYWAYAVYVCICKNCWRKTSQNAKNKRFMARYFCLLTRNQMRQWAVNIEKNKESEKKMCATWFVWQSVKIKIALMRNNKFSSKSWGYEHTITYPAATAFVEIYQTLLRWKREIERANKLLASFAQ